MTAKARAVTNAITVGLTIGPDDLYASWPRGRATERWTHIAERGDVAGVIPRAFDDLASAIGSSARVRLRVALMPPLAPVRRVELPPMSNAERRSVVRRNAERWFLHAREPLATAEYVVRTPRRAPSTLLVSAASEALLEAIHAGAAAHGWSVDLIIPAVAAWQAYASPVLARSAFAGVLVCTRREWLILRQDKRRLQCVRRLRPHALELRASIGNASNIVVLATPADRARVMQQLDGIGVAAGTMGPETAALNGLHRATRTARSFDLLPAARRVARERRISRAALGIAAAAAALCIAAAGMRLIGLHREIAAVRTARRAQHAKVERSLVLRDSLATLTARLDALGALEREAPQWSAVIGNVATRLPDDAHLVGLRAVGDSLLLDGQAANAANVFTAMHEAKGLTSISAPAPIRQEVVPGQPTVEHWTMLARVGGGGDTK